MGRRDLACLPACLPACLLAGGGAGGEARDYTVSHRVEYDRIRSRYGMWDGIIILCVNEERRMSKRKFEMKALGLGLLA
jgi:hypothetical protein